MPNAASTRGAVSTPSAIIARARSGSEPARDLESDGDVPVVPAGVHLAGVRRTVGDGVRFFDGQRVHVGAQQYTVAVATALEGRHPRFPDPALHVVAEPLQPLGDEPAGPRFLEAQLGMLVEVAAGGNETRPVDWGESVAHRDPCTPGLRPGSVRRGPIAALTPGASPGITEPAEPLISCYSAKVCSPRT